MLGTVLIYSGTYGRSPMPTPTVNSGQTAMACTLTEAHHAAHQARERGAEQLEETMLQQIRSHYHGALARGDDDNQGQHTTLADKARAPSLAASDGSKI